MKRQQTLLNKKGIAVLLSILMLLFMSGCSATSSSENKEVYSNLDWIYFQYQYGSENEIIFKEFNAFLENKFEDKQKILEKFAKYEADESLKRDEYFQEKEKLQEALHLNQISEDEFDEKEDRLWNDYQESISLKKYFSEEEQEIFESSKEEIERLYKLSF